MTRRSTDEDLSAEDRSLLKVLEDYGWYVIKVGAGTSKPAFAYSLGLYETFGHPEIVMFGLDLDTMHELINDCGERIRGGGCFKNEDIDTHLLENYRCAFRAIQPSIHQDLFAFTRWYYRGWVFPALQLVWPDMSDRFPWDAGFDERYRSDQPLLD